MRDRAQPGGERVPGAKEKRWTERRKHSKGEVYQRSLELMLPADFLL